MGPQRGRRAWPLLVALALSAVAVPWLGATRAGGTQAPPPRPTAKVVINFEDLKSGEVVTDQYAARGVTFDGPFVREYVQGVESPPSLAHSGTKVARQGPRWCDDVPSTSDTGGISIGSASRLSASSASEASPQSGPCRPVTMTFTPPARRLALWVGYEGCLTQPVTVRLQAFDAEGARVAEDKDVVPVNSGYGSRADTRLETAAGGGITRATVSMDLVVTNGYCPPEDGRMLVDDVEVEAPAATMAPDPVDFATVPVGGTGATRPMTVTSTGKSDLRVLGGAVVAGANAADFTVARDACRDAVLAPKASCTVDLQFRPGAAGARQATLTVRTDAPGNPGRVALKGTGTGEAVAPTITPPSLDFGAARVGTPGATRAVTVGAPAGRSPVEVDDVAIEPPTGDFALVGTACSGLTLHPGTSCAVEVRFQPGALGSRAATLRITTGAARVSHPVTLRGTGTASDVPAATLAPSPLDFGTVQVGGEGARRSLTVTNAGTAVLAVRRVTVGGADARDFTSLADRCSGAVVAPGANCVVDLVFRPGAALHRRASLSVTTNAADSPHDVGLRGSGVAVLDQSLTRPPTVAVKPANGPPGTKVTVTGEGYQGLTRLSWHSPGPGTPLAALVPDEAHRITVDVVVPADATPGPHHVEACDSRGACAEGPFSVALSVEPAASSFPRLVLVLLAVALVGGAALVPVGMALRRRPRGPSPPDGGGGDRSTPTYGGGGRDRPVYTGFAPEGDYAAALDPSQPLAPNRSYHFWLELGPPPSPSPASARLTVALFGFEGEIEIGADVGQVELRGDGSTAVVQQGGLHTTARPGDQLLGRRVFFPVRTPAQEGVHRLRCSLYHDHVLVQSWLVSAAVRGGAKPPTGGPGGADPQTRERDFVLSRTLDPAHLARMSPHRLSLMLNDNGEGTHGFRLMGEGGFKADATFDVEELREHGSQTRGALRRVACGVEDEGGSQGAYRYDGPVDLDRLAADLATLARRGYRVYSAIVHRLAAGASGEGRTPADRLAALLRRPGRLQLCNKRSARQALPAGMIYDRDLDDALPQLALCPAFVDALRADIPLEATACFTGDCPTQGEPDVVCPSGFWGFRHVIGVPQSIGDEEVGALEAPLEVSDGSELVVDVAVSTDPQFVRRRAHEEVLRSLHARMDWRYGDTRAEVLSLLRSTQPHLVYFYCHGGMDERSNVPFLEVGAPGETPITGSNLLAYKVVWDRSHPLVVINGCHTTALGPQTPLELVSAFVQHSQAAGVIGTEITVFEPLACQFAEELLRRVLAGGQPVGDAVRGARLALLKQGNPLGLAYVPFVTDDLRLVDQPSRQAAHVAHGER